jgi:Tfp pilus tip-associated adhesin PilY1
MPRPKHALGNLGFAAGLFAMAAFLLLAGGEPAWTDDTDLLRFNTGNPYLFIVLDTSASMNLMLDQSAGATALADADTPGTRLYEAKRAIYTVFKDVSDVHFGLVTYNQDALHVLAKHWLYAVSSTTVTAGTWPLRDGSVNYPVPAEILTFGKHFTTTPVIGEGGSCAAPLTYSTDRAAIDRFSKLDTDGNGTSKLWIKDGGKTYLVTVTRNNGTLGDANNPLLVDFRAEVRSGAACATVGSIATLQATLRASSPFDFLLFDAPSGSAVTEDESAGYWNFQDAVATATSGAGRPFTGNGWEGNYDSGFVSGDAAFDASTDKADLFCLNDSNNVNKCMNLHYPTSRSSAFMPPRPHLAELDSGDLMPPDWRDTDGNRDEMIRRMAPNLRSGAAVPDFGIASYFKNTPDFPNSGNNAILDLKEDNERPLIAYGNSPLGRVINDYRCWWNGTSDNKCKGTRSYQSGFEQIAVNYDPEWGCRRPYLLLISDGEDNSTAEAPNADVANLNSKSGIKTWAINLGDPNNCKGSNKLASIANQGKGECVTAGNPAALQTELQTLLGQIREDSRSFASAAVPSVQATVEDKIFLTNFNPIAGASVWDGHVLAFLKPLPLKNGRPDTSIKCSALPASQQAACNLWDAGTVLLTQAPPASDPSNHLGAAPDARRIFYSQTKAQGTWAEKRRLFSPVVAGTPTTVKYDFWNALGVAFTAGNAPSEASAVTTSTNIVRQTVVQKTAALTQRDPATGLDVTINITYVMGDVFHSNPLVVGSPANTKYFAQNTATDGTTCASGDRGYRCFFEKHDKRRKLLVMGGNDAMLHAFDGGKWDDPNLEYDNGTGKEVFAFMPRPAMPTATSLATGTTRKWSVDGTVAVADMFIDPAHDGTPAQSDREWRTVLVGGMREGGYGYYAIDMTQPDKLSTATGKTDVPLPDNGYVPSCLGSINTDGLTPLSAVPSGCGPVPFPAELWEFVDAALDASGNVVRDSSGNPILLNEDGIDLNNDNIPDNLFSDLGETWSIPNLGRIHLCKQTGSNCKPGSADIEDRYVAVFGGGLDPLKSNARGNWLYMVDVETGKVIYKRLLEGSAPSAPAAVDIDQDGYIDRIYITTTSGFLYRADLGVDSAGDYPKLQTTAVTGADGNTYTALRIPALDSSNRPLWAPYKIFSTGGREIYFRPSVIFVAKLGKYALSFGTGDREDLWSKSGVEGRFYVFVDDSDQVAVLPMTEATLQVVNVSTTASPDVTNTDYLLGRPIGSRGWYLRLNADERVITDSFALSGVTFFSSYQPNICENGVPDPITHQCPTSSGSGGGNNNQPKVCSKTGSSKVFIVNTTNANTFMVAADGTRTRYLAVSDFVTNPYTEQSSTKNPATTQPTGTNADQLTASLTQVMNELKKLFPQNCKFTNYRLDIKTISSDTGVVFIAPVPVCIIEKNWKEF